MTSIGTQDVARFGLWTAEKATSVAKVAVGLAGTATMTILALNSSRELFRPDGVAVVQLTSLSLFSQIGRCGEFSCWKGAQGAQLSCIERVEVLAGLAVPVISLVAWKALSRLETKLHNTRVSMNSAV